MQSQAQPLADKTFSAPKLHDAVCNDAVMVESMDVNLKTQHKIAALQESFAELQEKSGALQAKLECIGEKGASSEAVRVTVCDKDNMDAMMAEPVNANATPALMNDQCEELGRMSDEFLQNPDGPMDAELEDLMLQRATPEEDGTSLHFPHFCLPELLHAKVEEQADLHVADATQLNLVLMAEAQVGGNMRRFKQIYLQCGGNLDHIVLFLKQDVALVRKVCRLPMSPDVLAWRFSQGEFLPVAANGGGVEAISVLLDEVYDSRFDVSAAEQESKQEFRCDESFEYFANGAEQHSESGASFPATLPDLSDLFASQPKVDFGGAEVIYY